MRPPAGGDVRSAERTQTVWAWPRTTLDEAPVPWQLEALDIEPQASSADATGMRSKLAVVRERNSRRVSIAEPPFRASSAL
jgi:hypothetical protein